MEEIDELVPIDEADIKTLQSKITTSSFGCAAAAFVFFLITALAALFFLSITFLGTIVLGIISVCSLFLAIGSALPGSKEKNEQIALDIREGKKRRIVAPIEIKDSSDVTSNKVAFTVAGQLSNANKELKFKYYMMVKGYKFDLTEKEFLAGARKGDFVEFYGAPHSGVALSKPIAVRK